MSFIGKIKNKIISKSNGYNFYKSKYSEYKQLIVDKNNALRDRNRDIRFFKGEIAKKDKLIDNFNDKLNTINKTLNSNNKTQEELLNSIHTSLSSSRKENSILNNVISNTMEQYFNESKDNLNSLKTTIGHNVEDFNKQINANNDFYISQFNNVLYELNKSQIIEEEQWKNIYQTINENKLEFNNLIENIRDISANDLKNQLNKIIAIERGVQELRNNINIDREINYGIIFKDTISNSKWLKNQSFSLNNGAANYSFLYLIYRILDEMDIKNILELGLGQTTKITSQYANYNKNSYLTVVDDDKNWIDSFSNQLNLSENISIKTADREKCPKFEENNSFKYKDLDLKDKFDLIIVDGPFGYNPENGVKSTYPRTNILDLIDNNIKDDFIIIIDDYDRKGEQKTAKLLMEKLSKKGLKYHVFRTWALKNQIAIFSEKYSFIRWF
ncbi:MAG: hypothetical protein LBM96_00375 [Methanobrevibacter sp.]|jgi:hypothetical protein|nr:hypothetical protein [Candidatus Methanoflexus mossambicus]